MESNFPLDDEGTSGVTMGGGEEYTPLEVGQARRPVLLFTQGALMCGAGKGYLTGEGRGCDEASFVSGRRIQTRGDGRQRHRRASNAGKAGIDLWRALWGGCVCFRKKHLWLTT